MQDDQPTHSNDTETNSSVPLSRRGVLAAGSVLGLGLAASTGAASAQSDDDEGDGDRAPFAAEDHDHAGDYLGESAPVDRIDVGTVRADEVSTTYYADSVAELNEYLDEIEDSPSKMGQTNGVKIVLRSGELDATADQLPIELEGGVIIEGQGRKITQINVEGIGKPVFKFDRSGQKVARSVTLRDLKVIGKWGDWAEIGRPEPGSMGVLLKNIHYWSIENCQFVGLEDGIVLPGSWTGTVSNTRVEMVGRDGIRLEVDGPMGANNIQIVNSVVKGRGRDNRNGITARVGASLYVAGTDISGFGQYAILTDDMKGVAVHGCHFEFNGQHLDRDDDGAAEPVAIGLSPDSTHERTTGVSIVGNRIGYPPNPDRVGIKLNNVDGVHIAGNWNGWPNRGFVELGPLMRDVTVQNNTKYYSGEFSEGLIVGPLDGSNIPTHELNDGVWHTSAFASYGELATLARDHTSEEAEDAITVVIGDDLAGDGPVIDGTDFPAGTLFRGVGTGGTTVETINSDGDAPAVFLARRGQAARDLVVESAGSGSGVELDAAETSVADVSIPNSGGVAAYVSPRAERCSVTNVVCGSAVGGDVDVDVDGEGARVVGCDASVDAADVDECLDLNVDTQ